MTNHPSYQHALLLFALLLFGGCEVPVSAPIRDNPHDPDTIYWIPPSPYIYNLAVTPDSAILVSWISHTSYAAEVKIERRIATVGSYSLVGVVQRSLPRDTFTDTTFIPRGHTYGYRVGVVSRSGVVSYSYDFNIDYY